MIQTIRCKHGYAVMLVESRSRPTMPVNFLPPRITQMILLPRPLVIGLMVFACAAVGLAEPDVDQIVEQQRQVFEKIPGVAELLKRDADVKRRFEKWLVANARDQLAAQLDAEPTNVELRQELLDRMQCDQEARKTATPDQWEKVDRDNQQWLKGVIAEFGWPGKSLVGRDGAHAAWVIAQHANLDRPFQLQCLELMNAAPKSEVSSSDVAYLVDRVCEAEGRPQMFGTQLKQVDGRLVLKEISDPESTNELREQAALMPIEIYLLFANADNPLPAKQIAATKNRDVADSDAANARSFVGLWSTTSAQTTFILDIRADGTCLLVYIGEGSQAQQGTWKKLPGGILVDTLPRFRFWPGRHRLEARVEIETLPADMTSSDIREFPRSFFMRRSESNSNLVKAFATRELPANWSNATLSEDWDKTAGRGN